MFLAGIFYGFWENLAGLLRGFFFYIIRWISGYGTGVIQYLVGEAATVLPFGISTAWVDMLSPYLEILNAWVPIDLLFTVWGSYKSLSMLVYAYRFALKLIPGIG